MTTPQPEGEPTLEELLEMLATVELYRVDMRPNPGFVPSLGFPLREHLLWLRNKLSCENSVCAAENIGDKC